MTNDVNIENLYATILDLHYIRNTLYNHEDLDKSADYIMKKFKDLGLQCEFQTFTISESEKEFKNIIAVYNPGKEKEFLITAHYDHLYYSVGADDNLSGVAIMLEAARIISSFKLDITVKFISFTLEEGHSGFEKVLINKSKKLGLINEKRIPTSYKNKLFLDSITKELMTAYDTGEDFSKVLEKIIENRNKDFDQKELEYITFRKEFRREMEKELPKSALPGALVGSYYYVEQNKNELNRVVGVINMDAVGYTSKKKNSQAPINGLDFNKFNKK